MIFGYVSEKWGSKIAPIEPSDTTDECWGSNRPANGGFLDSQMGKAVYPIYTRWDNAPSDFTGMFARWGIARWDNSPWTTATLARTRNCNRGCPSHVHHMFIEHTPNTYSDSAYALKILLMERKWKIWCPMAHKHEKDKWFFAEFRRPASFQHVANTVFLKL